MGTIELRRYFINLLFALVGLNLTFLIAFNLTFNELFSLRQLNFEASYRVLLIICNLLYLSCYTLPNGFQRSSSRTYTLFTFVYLGLLIIFQASEFSRFFHVVFLSCFFFYTQVLGSLIFSRNIDRLIASAQRPNSVAVIGNDFDRIILEYIEERLGIHDLKAFFYGNEIPTQQKEIPEGVLYEPISEITNFFKKGEIDELLILPVSIENENLDLVIQSAEQYQIRINFLPPYFTYLASQHCQTEVWRGLPVISVAHSKLSLFRHRIFKRIFDIFFSLIFLMVVFPILFFLVAPCTLLSSRGPIFFRQLRKGYRQIPFGCYKFRTMSLGFEGMETVQAMRSDPRITKFGQFLRKSSLDEMPQFINVLMGKMSIVGPRPHMVEHDEFYNKIIDRYNVRFVTKPGITGWAQINGLRGGTEDPRLMQTRVEYDLWYIKNWSFLLDLKIIFLTIRVLLKKDTNAY